MTLAQPSPTFHILCALRYENHSASQILAFWLKTDTEQMKALLFQPVRWFFEKLLPIFLTISALTHPHTNHLANQILVWTLLPIRRLEAISQSNTCLNSLARQVTGSNWCLITTGWMNSNSVTLYTYAFSYQACQTQREGSICAVCQESHCMWRKKKEWREWVTKPHSHYSHATRHSTQPTCLSATGTWVKTNISSF